MHIIWKYRDTDRTTWMRNTTALFKKMISRNDIKSGMRFDRYWGSKKLKALLNCKTTLHLNCKWISIPNIWFCHSQLKRDQLHCTPIPRAWKPKNLNGGNLQKNGHVGNWTRSNGTGCISSIYSKMEGSLKIFVRYWKLDLISLCDSYHTPWMYKWMNSLKDAAIL